MVVSNRNGSNKSWSRRCSKQHKGGTSKGCSSASLEPPLPGRLHATVAARRSAVNSSTMVPGTRGVQYLQELQARNGGAQQADERVPASDFEWFGVALRAELREEGGGSRGGMQERRALEAAPGHIADRYR